ncbi:uncharacterized protein A4U43_C03F3820 [Asparagus officinalis]|uniref:Uncharacterized protein n=1 Tax=Asparagus officinalis TaxID=4686 RepID=A0A5P1FBJ5_ASPOF|nr:uncharacterized protein LOC109832847 [Asparagus officinalis]ONK74199.1 uncharacterized protein A4U43_C03F3820 [Asparagus officinalis]
MPVWRFGLVSWVNRKVVDPLIQIIKRGAEAKQLAFSTGLGITLGMFPIFGAPVVLSGVAIALLRSRCHAPSIMLANFIATPLQISLVIPYLRFGEIICGGPRFPLTPDALKKVLTGQASREVLLAVSHAVIGWVVAAPFILGVLYIVLVPCFKYLVKKLRPSSSPETELDSHDEFMIKVRDA